MQSYSQNKIDPKYKLQSFISEDKIEYMLQNDYFGFDLQGLNGTLSMLEQQTGKQYLTFMPAFLVSKVGQLDPLYIMLDIIQCQSQKLKNYKCIDFSKSQGYQLVQNDYSNYTSELIIVVYKCTDTDFFKKTVPTNCASDKEINDLINDKNQQFEIKMKVSQFNTTSEKMEERYKRYYTNLQTNFMVYANQMSTKLQTDVKQGIFQQNTQTYSSIIDYANQQQRSFDRETLKQLTNIYALLQLNIVLDEQVQYAQIQYVSILEVLSIFNSTFAILMGAGLLSRYFSKRIIYDQFYQSFFKEFFSQSQIQAKMQISQDLEQSNANKNNEIQKNIMQFQNFISFLKSKQNNFQIEQNSKEDIKIDKEQQLDCDMIEIDEQNGIRDYQLQQMNSIQIDKINKNSFLKYQMQFSKLQLTPSNETTKDLFQQNTIIEQDVSPLINNLLLQNSIKKQDNTTNKSIQHDKQNINPTHKLLPFPLNDLKRSFNKNIQMSKIIENRYDQQNQPRQVDKNIIKTFIELQKKNININKLKKNLENQEGMKFSEIKDLFDRSLNIYEIYKDIQFIKKALRILLSVEQYAAIQLIGYSIDNQNQQQNERNHINLQIKQENSQEELIQNLCNFFEKMLYQNEYGQIDQRILNSLIV